MRFLIGVVLVLAIGAAVADSDMKNTLKSVETTQNKLNLLEAQQQQTELEEETGISAAESAEEEAALVVDAGSGTPQSEDLEDEDEDETNILDDAKAIADEKKWEDVTRKDASSVRIEKGDDTPESETETEVEEEASKLNKKHFPDYKSGSVKTCEGKLLGYRKAIRETKDLNDREIEVLSRVVRIIEKLDTVGTKDLETGANAENDEEMLSVLLTQLSVERPHDESRGAKKVIQRLISKLHKYTKDQRDAYASAVRHCQGECASATRAKKALREKASGALKNVVRKLRDHVKKLEILSGKVSEMKSLVRGEEKQFRETDSVAKRELRLLSTLISKLQNLRHITSDIEMENQPELSLEESDEMLAAVEDADLKATPSYVEIETALVRKHSSVKQISNLLKALDVKIRKEREAAEGRVKHALKKLGEARATLSRQRVVVKETVGERKIAKSELERHRLILRRIKKRCERIDSLSLGSKSLKTKRRACKNILPNGNFLKGTDHWTKNQGVTISQDGNYFIVKSEQSASTPGIRQDNISLVSGRHYKIVVKGYKSSAGFVCPWSDDSHGRNELWGCNQKRSLHDKDSTTVGYFKASATRHRVGVLFSGMKKGDYFALRSAKLCLLSKTDVAHARIRRHAAAKKADKKPAKKSVKKSVKKSNGKLTKKGPAPHRN